MEKKNINSLLNYQIPEKVLNKLLLVVLFVFSCFLFLFNTEAIATAGDNMQSFVFWLTTTYGLRAFITFIVLLIILFCLCNNLFISYVIMEFLTIVLGISNRIVLLLRDQYITIADFDVLGDAAGVSIDFNIFYHPLIIVLIFIGGINGVFIWILERKINKECSGKKTGGMLIIGRLLIIIILMFIFIQLHARTNKGALVNVWAYRDTGCVVWFCQNLFGNTTDVVSADDVQDIYNGFIDSVEEEIYSFENRPNIIVIMSEAFWDINNLEGIIEASENPMDKYYELVDGAVIGSVAVNVYGGGTNRTEFEFLSGINTRYLSNPDCYGKYYIKKQESLVSYMKELGYYAMAFHPGEGSFWERDIGFANMGFEDYYFEEDFLNREICHGYISDKSLTKEIIERFEEHKSTNPGQPVFSFAVSIQNHVSDMKDIDMASKRVGCTGITINGNGLQISKELLVNIEEYYNGMRESLEALEELMYYFDNYEEDTVIVFFGDHAPGFVNQICDTEGKETELSLYRTPYLIWTNYKNDNKTYGDISASYLSSVMIDYLDLPKPYHYYMNMYMVEHYPINTFYEQKMLDSLDEDKLLDMMSIISTVHKRFPKEEMALPFWQIVQ